MHYNDQQSRNIQSGGGRKLMRRPMETPGLESTRNSQFYTPEDGSQFSQSQKYDDGRFQTHHTHSSYSSHDSLPSSVLQTKVDNYQYLNPSVSSPGFSQTHVLRDPLVANVAVQYGQAIVASGRQIVDKELEKYVAVSKLKYYFAVDTGYVSKKLSIILFPYFHSDWSVKYDQNESIQPKFEVNAPDLYIPTMAFLTYILAAGLTLGTKYEFSPEKLSIEATNALLWTTLEVIIQLSTLYISNINTNLKTYDLIAYSSYKYVSIVTALLINLLFGHFGYLASLIYLNISLAFFLMRTLKLQILAEPMSHQKDIYGIPQPSIPSIQQTGLKRRQYFLLFVSCSQAVLIWWLTWRII